MAVKYLYIDDQQDDTANGIIKKLSNNLNELQIVLERALSWDDQIKKIQESINNYDGLLLDLKLELSSENKSLYHYAPALAQEIRSLIKRRIIKDLPIILCSTDDNLRDLYDVTGYDLFDDCFDKTKLTNSDSDNFLAHVEAFQRISDEVNDLNSLLKIETDDTDILEEVIQCYNLLNTIHGKAQFLLGQVIEPMGILIDEDTLAIRLGIDIENSTEDWIKLKDHFEYFKYKGIYSSIKNRWWVRGLFQWWTEKFPNAKPLMLLTSIERINQIKEKFSLNELKSIGSFEHQKSLKYWYKCANIKLKTKKIGKIVIPIAEGDGFACLPPLYPWQDREFISYSYVWKSNINIDSEVKKLLSPYELELFDNVVKKRNEL